MKILKDALFTMGTIFFLMLSIEPLQMYDDSWMIGSYFCHMCVLFLYFIFFGISHKTTSFYILGAHCTITISLMLLSLYPFFYESENLTDFIYKYWEYRIEPYEGGIIVTLCIIISELYLLGLLCAWIGLIKELQKQKKRKYSLLLGVLFPLFLIWGYATNIYIDYATKDKEITQREKQWEEKRRIEQIKKDIIKFQNDSINKELLKKHVELSFGGYKLGASKYYNNGKPYVNHLLDKEIRNVTTEEYNGLIYKIIVRFEAMATSSLFIENVADLYIKKYGKTGTFAKWNFKNGSIEIKKVGTETKKQLDINWLPTYHIYEDVEYDVVGIIYTDHKLDSIVKQEKALKEELRVKEYEERKKAEEKEKRLKEEEMKKEKELEIEMI